MAAALGGILFVIVLMAPFILIGLLVYAVRTNNAKRRAFEQKRQADQISAGVAAALAASNGQPVQAVPAPQPIPWWKR